MKTLGTACAQALMSSPALAGSMRLPPQPVVLPTIEVTADTWSGFYVGLGVEVVKFGDNDRVLSRVVFKF